MVSTVNFSLFYLRILLDFRATAQRNGLTKATKKVRFFQFQLEQRTGNPALTLLTAPEKVLRALVQQKHGRIPELGVIIV